MLLAYGSGAVSTSASGAASTSASGAASTSGAASASGIAARLAALLILNVHGQPPLLRLELPLLVLQFREAVVKGSPHGGRRRPQSGSGRGIDWGGAGTGRGIDRGGAGGGSRGSHCRMESWGKPKEGQGKPSGMRLRTAGARRFKT